MGNDTLLERYLQAVGKYLPEVSRADVLAELRANLLEQMDGREEALGRSLTEAEVAVILREHGKPEAVALRYLPQRSLIGPMVYPFYAYTLKKTLPLVVFVYTVAEAVEFVVGGHVSAATALAEYAIGFVPAMLWFYAAITIVFAVINYVRETQGLGPKWHEWDPMKLPAVRAPEPVVPGMKSLPKRVLDLGLHCLWFAYVLWVPWHPFWLMGPGVFYFGTLDVVLAPVWHTFYALLIVLLSVQLVMKLMAFVPSLLRVIPPMELVTNLLGLVAIGMLAKSSVFFVAAHAGADVANLAHVNEGIGLAMRVALVVSFAGFLKQARMYAKGWQGARQFAF